MSINPFHCVNCQLTPIELVKLTNGWSSRSGLEIQAIFTGELTLLKQLYRSCHKYWNNLFTAPNTREHSYTVHDSELCCLVSLSDIYVTKHAVVHKHNCWRRGLLFTDGHHFLFPWHNGSRWKEVSYGFANVLHKGECFLFLHLCRHLWVGFLNPSDLKGPLTWTGKSTSV